MTLRFRPYAAALMVVLVVSACIPFRVGAQTSYCLPSDHNQTLTRDWVIRLVTAPTGTADAAERDSVRLPVSASTNVSVVTDTKTCERAGKALSAAVVPQSTTARRVHLIKVLDRFVVYDPAFAAGEFGRGAVFDSRWRVLEYFIQ